MSTETVGKDIAIELAKGEVVLKIINPAPEQKLAVVALTPEIVSTLQLAIATFWAEIGRRKNEPR